MATFISRKCYYVANKDSHKHIRYRDMNNFDPEKFCQELIEQDLCNLTNSASPDLALEEWTNKFINVLDCNAPIKQKRVKRTKQPEWINEEVLSAIKQRKKIT